MALGPNSLWGLAGRSLSHLWGPRDLQEYTVPWDETVTLLQTSLIFDVAPEIIRFYYIYSYI